MWNNDSWRQSLIFCLILQRSLVHCSSVNDLLPVRHTSPDTFFWVLGQLSYHSERQGNGQCIVGAKIVLRPDRHSLSRELIITRMYGAQAVISSPYCVHSPHLRSLCCVAHSEHPVQLFLYKKLQNSILQREKNRDKQWVGEGDTNMQHTDTKCKTSDAAELKRS